MLIAALLCFPTAWLFQRWAWPPLRVSPETTFITAPLPPDGRPDYVGYLNDLHSQGVTPENNAAVVLSRLTDMSTIPAESQQEYFSKLGIPVPMEQNKLISWDNFAKLKGYSEPRLLALQDVISDSKTYSHNQHPELEELLTINHAQLDLAVEGLRRNRNYRPILDHSGKGLQASNWLPNIQGTRELARLLALRSRHRRQTGDLSGAVTDMIATCRLARLPLANGFLIELLVGYAVEGVAMSLLEEAFLQGDFDEEMLLRIRRELESLPPPLMSAEVFNISERMYILDGVCRIRPFRTDTDGEYRLKLGADINQVLKRVNRAMDGLVEIARIADLRERHQRITAWESRLSPDPDASPILKPIYKYFGKTPPISIGHDNAAALINSNLSPTLSAESRILVKRALLRHSLSLAEYRARHGRFPDSLDQLIPEFEPEVPRDPWTDGALKYQPRDGGFMLWSCGPNGIDDGGRTMSDTPEGDDIRFGLKPVE